eukprot:scaffold90106_cov18-Tisochrysis_lutea.AAC.1
MEKSSFKIVNAVPAPSSSVKQSHHISNVLACGFQKNACNELCKLSSSQQQVLEHKPQPLTTGPSA